MNIHDEYTYLIFKENDTEVFEIDSFANEHEIERITSWYNIIGKEIDFEKTDTSIKSTDLSEFHDILGKKIRFEKHKDIKNDIKMIKKHIDLKEKIKELKSEYHSTIKKKETSEDKNVILKDDHIVQGKKLLKPKNNILNLIVHVKNEREDKFINLRKIFQCLALDEKTPFILYKYEDMHTPWYLFYKPLIKNRVISEKQMREWIANTQYNHDTKMNEIRDSSIKELTLKRHIYDFNGEPKYATINIHKNGNVEIRLDYKNDYHANMKNVYDALVDIVCMIKKINEIDYRVDRRLPKYKINIPDVTFDSKNNTIHFEKYTNLILIDTGEETSEDDEETSEDENDEEAYKGYFVVYHEDSHSTFLINNPKTIDINLLGKKKQGFKKCLELNENKLVEIAKQLFNETIFNNEQDFTDKINMFNKLTNCCVESFSKNKEEKELIEEYINDKYIITDNINEKIKASDICHEIENFLNKKNPSIFKIGDISFRNRLSKYLLDSGLKKKRFGNGFYYYGLIPFDKTKNEILYEDENVSELISRRDRSYRKMHTDIPCW